MYFVDVNSIKAKDVIKAFIDKYDFKTDKPIEDSCLLDLYKIENNVKYSVVRGYSSFVSNGTHRVRVQVMEVE